MVNLSRRSRGSGRHSVAERATWKRRPGSRGGLRSEAQKSGLAPGRKELRAFIKGLGRHGHPAGCHGSHDACLPLIRELERRGGFRWNDLDADTETARAAWGALSAAALDELGLSDAAWSRVLVSAGWPGWWTDANGRRRPDGA